MNLFHSLANGGVGRVDFFSMVGPDSDDAIGVCEYRPASQPSPVHNAPTLAELRKGNSGTLEKQ
jgi:hypothetical protein